jgi:hypothetical protein
MQTVMSVEELEEFILDRLPGVLERNPRFVTFVEGIVAEKFPRRDEFARLLDEVQQHRKETSANFQQVDERFQQVDERFQQVDQRFQQVDRRFDEVDARFDGIDQRLDKVDARIDSLEQRMDDGFRAVQIGLDRLGQRWGIRNESVFRQTMRELLEKSYGAQVEARHIGGEQYDCVIIDGAHILVEISASVGQDIVKKLQRKRQIYIDATGVTPARFILAVGSIHSRRANALREAGFEVIEPEEDEIA